MLELRKDIFADERDDNLKEIGKARSARTCSAMSPATSTYFNDHKLQGMLHLKVLRSPHSTRGCAASTSREAERSPGRAPRSSEAPTCRAISTRC